MAGIFLHLHRSPSLQLSAWWSSHLDVADLIVTVKAFRVNYLDSSHILNIRVCTMTTLLVTWILGGNWQLIESPGLVMLSPLQAQVSSLPLHSQQNLILSVDCLDTFPFLLICLGLRILYCFLPWPITMHSSLTFVDIYLAESWARSTPSYSI